ncbi:hypothetical protein [Micromonospora sp. WMMD987]|uniref:hypothetical protein n=1 Tax=Micromonospora TaxID=1873 RepID=UPI00249B9B51|nr:hypothetical protein [Micromonospora sp. WMMD987]WFE94577.1 hypothetical protein O7612_25085 [Micromonospora sp. WMMD987]
MTEFDGPTVVISRADGPTATIAAVTPPTPVFVDPTGRRHSRLRWFAYALGLVGLIYTGLVGVSFAGGIAPHAVLPFVDEVAQPERSPSPSPGATTRAPAAGTVAPTDVAPPTAASRKPAAGTPAAVPVTPSAVRSTGTPSPSPSASRSPSRSPATGSASPRPTRPAPTTTTPPAPEPTDEPPTLPDPVPGDGGRVDG